MQQLPKDIQRLLLFHLSAKSTYTLTQLSRERYQLINEKLREKLQHNLLEIRSHNESWDNVLVTCSYLPNGLRHGQLIGTYIDSKLTGKILRYRNNIPYGLQERWFRGGQQFSRYWDRADGSELHTKWYANGQMEQQLTETDNYRRVIAWDSTGDVVDDLRYYPPISSK